MNRAVIKALGGLCASVRPVRDSGPWSRRLPGPRNTTLCLIQKHKGRVGLLNTPEKNAKHHHLGSRFRTFFFRCHCFLHSFFDLWETSIHHTVLLKLGMAGPCTACDKYRQTALSLSLSLSLSL